jgi:hypothetical protein
LTASPAIAAKNRVNSRVNNLSDPIAARASVAKTRELPGKNRVTTKPVFSFFSEMFLLFHFNEKY